MRWGIIGAGGIAGVFARNLEHAAGAAKRAVGSRDAAKAQAFADEHGFEVAYGSYEELLADDAVDAVYVATPHTVHAPCVIAAAKAGKHILCEKPMAVTPEEGEAMRAAADAAGVVLLEAFMYRCHPQTQRLVDLVRGGAIGEVRSIRSCFTFGLGEAYNVRTDKALRGGGLYDVGCYCIHFSRLIAGGEPDTISSAAVVDPATGVDVHLAVSLGFERCVASFDVGIKSAGTADAEIIGTEGRIVIPAPWKPDAGRSSFTVHAKGQPAQEVVIEDGGHIFALEAEHLATVVAGEAEPLLTAEDAIANAVVLDAVWRQIHPT